MARNTLSITPEVLGILFPEGSEARIILQQAAVQEVGRMFVGKKLPAAVAEHLDDLVGKKAVVVRDACYKELGITDGVCNPVPEKYRELVAKRLDALVSTQMHILIEEGINQRLEAAVAKLDQYIEERLCMRVNRYLVSSLNDRISTKVVERVKAVLLEITQEELNEGVKHD